MTTQQDDERLGKPQDARWQKLTNAAWTILFIVALGILIASLPGYARYVSNTRFNDVDASPAFVMVARVASMIASFAAACLSIVLSAILFWRKRSETMAIFASFFIMGHGIIMAGPLEALNAFEPGDYTSAVFAIQSALFTTPTMLFFCLFPNGRFVPRWTRYVALASLIYVPIGFYFSPANLFNFKSPFIALAGCGYFVFVVIGVYAQIFRYRRVSTLQERQQTKWFVFGTFVWLAFSILISIPYVVLQNLPVGARLPWWSSLSQLGWFVSLTLLPLFFAIAIMRYRLWDIDILISRALVYGALTAIVIGLYIALVGALSGVFQLSGNLFTSLLATGVVAALIQPLRERLQRAVNHFVYGARDEPISVLTTLGERLESSIAPENVLPTLVESISHALRLPYVAILLKEGTEFILAADSGNAPAINQTCERLPLNYQGAPIGQILVSRRAGEDSFRADEMILLQNVARQVGAAVYAAQLTRDLQRSRERLVSAREEERRRLRRDLHDGLGPTLASLTLKLDAARNQLKERPDKTESLLVELKSQTQSAIEDIRRLAYNLRPPALDELGLFSAIQEYAANRIHAGLSAQIKRDGELPKLSAAVEVAAYRIICEALTNIAKHAQATECLVRLGFKDHLSIEVQDNGRGLSEDAHSGVGMLSMRERAAELGGTFDIQSTSGGVRIVVHLPCEVPEHES